MNDNAISQADKVKALTEQLKEGVQEVFRSGKYAEYLSVLSRFHRYSFRNSMLIYLQNPNATYVAGFQRWKTLERSVNKGEKGLQILAPAPYKVTVEVTHDENGNPLPEPVKQEVQRMSFKVTYVFDISQTSGKELPELAHRLTGQVGEYDRLMRALKKISPYPIVVEPIEGGANGYCSHKQQRIAIREGLSQEQTVKTTIHELAHVLLHTPDVERDRQAFEVQAESVAYVVCQHFGVDSSQYSFGYVAGWSGSVELEVLEQSLTVIQNGALQIIDSTEFALIEMERAEQALAMPPVAHQTELRQLWEIETNDPTTQEWRSLLEPDERDLVEQWDKEYARSLREKEPARTIQDKLSGAKAEADIQRHTGRTTKHYEMER